jgi:hypothetical protein
MRNAIRLFVSASLLLLLNQAANGAEAYAFRFRSQGSNGGTLKTEWRDELVFQNSTTQDQVIRLLDMTGGPGDRTPLVVPAGRTVVVSAIDTPALWSPEEFTALWLVHLDVPEGVTVHSRADAFSCVCLGGAPQSPVPDFGSFSMPVFRVLAPVGQRQVHMGADIGGQASRVNVGVYNAGSVDANVTADLYQASGDQLLDRRTLIVPPGAVVQISLSGSSEPPVLTPWLRYTTVTADQPSLSYAVSVGDDFETLPRIPFGAASAP